MTAVHDMVASAGQGPTVRPGWTLWRDWCRATGRDPGQRVDGDALAAFRDEVRLSDRNLAGLLAEARERGLLDISTADPWARVEQSFEPLATCLRGCPSTGWPAGYRGRRDAWLLVLTRGLRLTRAQALAIRPTDLSDDWQVAGRRLEVDNDPPCCPRCIATRWLTCREEEDHWSRSAVRALLVRAGQHHQHDQHSEHVCRQRGGITTTLPAWVTLAPALDRYGWISSGETRDRATGIMVQRPMTPRGLTRALALRCLPGATTSEVSACLTGGEEDFGDGSTPQARFDETTFDRLDQACDQADEINARVATLLAGADAVERSVQSADSPQKVRNRVQNSRRPSTASTAKPQVSPHIRH